MFWRRAGGLWAQQDHPQEERGRGRRCGGGSSRRRAVFHGGPPSGSRWRGGGRRQPHATCCRRRWGLLGCLASRRSPPQSLRDQRAVNKGVRGGRSSYSGCGGVRCIGGGGGRHPWRRDAARRPPVAPGHRGGTQQVSGSPGRPVRCGQLPPALVLVPALVPSSSPCSVSNLAAPQLVLQFCMSGRFMTNCCLSVPFGYFPLCLCLQAPPWAHLHR
jgi:hypothetical protein